MPAFPNSCFQISVLLLGLAAGPGLLGCARVVSATTSAAAADCLVYVGTNVASEQENTIYLYRLQAATGTLTRLDAQPGGAAPTYLTMDAARRHLYAVSETQTFRGAASGGVSAFAVDKKTGHLTLLNQQPSGGGAPCYISLDRSEKNVLVANYVGGNVSLLPVQADGRLAPAASVHQHEGRGPHPNQTSPHAHCILPDPSNQFAFAVDLGTDNVYGYRLNAKEHQLAPAAAPAFTAAPGAGPRHLTFHPDGRYAYLINELNSTITALQYQDRQYEKGPAAFTELQTVSMLPAGFTGPNSCADVHVSPDGRFVYGSNRGHNSLAVFAINPGDGRLTLVQHVSTQGQTPRNFALDPSGQLLLVANQNSNNIFTYRVDQGTGKLTPTGHSVEVPSPMFLQVVSDFTR
ncbi:6-phosphogluconolactonase [Hymenobacter daecheongensis DSM 21074]|uniref:6-phosphogluconolactonase n=1 Tax=Hymenobacter daecheongensis DSM 21074 TaxID=1121955 RepID=A0A1M6JQU3_9BACT|nr:lactonase family protein [Hymenobacter daecheongensis]SHJ49002.1 6-phosphogluconolactonase [Hymenobacter daecheongensis DSM 21074]